MEKLIESAKAFMVTGEPVQAFFCLALVAIEGLTYIVASQGSIAASQARIAARLIAWDDEGTLSITNYPNYHKS